MDDVMNQQRATLYKLRREVLSGDTLPERIKDLVESLIINLVNRHCPMEQIPGDWNLDHLEREVFEVFDLPVTLAQVVESKEATPNELERRSGIYCTQSRPMRTSGRRTLVMRATKSSAKPFTSAASITTGKTI